MSEEDWERHIKPRLCKFAAGRGDLEMLKWLRAGGCPWNEQACSGAAWGRHLKVLKWLRAEGCPWHEDACSFAAAGDQQKVLEWLRKQGFPWGELAWKSRIDAAGEEETAVLYKRTRDLVPDHDVPVTDGPSFKMVKWLQANGCPNVEW